MKVFIIMAVTADGFIANNHIQPTDWTSPEDKQMFRKLTKAAGVVIMGANTYKTVNKAMDERRTIVYTHHPETITAEGVEATSETPEALLERLAKDGFTEVAVIGGSPVNRLFLEAGVVDELYVTIEPFLWGQGINLFDKPTDKKLELLDVDRLNSSSVLLHYRIV